MADSIRKAKSKERSSESLAWLRRANGDAASQPTRLPAAGPRQDEDSRTWRLPAPDDAPYIDERTPALREVRRSKAAVTRQDSGHRTALLVFFVGVALVGFALLREATVASRGAAKQAAFDRQADFRGRMDRHLLDAAVAIESQRIAASQLDVERTRARAAEMASEASTAVVSFGVPLKTQGFHLNGDALDRLAGRSDTEVDRIEGEIRRGVKNDRDAAEWEIRAQRMYVADFIRNARAAGWDVKVDKDLNVIYQRMPGFEEEADGQTVAAAGPSRMPQSISGSASGPEPGAAFSARLFAPYCPWLPALRSTAAAF